VKCVGDSSRVMGNLVRVVEDKGTRGPADECVYIQPGTGHEPLNEPIGVAADAATMLFHLPDYHVISTTINAGRRQVIIETDHPPGCPSCGVIASRRKERRLQRLRDIPVAGPAAAGPTWTSSAHGC
jgi:hypothetical protein